MSAAFTEDPQLDALLRQVAGVSHATDRAGPVEPPLTPGTHVGPYRLIDVAGAGGMGVVYRAFDERLAREVALKLLPKPTGGDLLQEARAAASLSHPNLASVYEAGTLDGHDYFAMELVRGTSLRALIGVGTPAQRLELAVGLARGLAAIHRAGWVHRDVKPENVMVTPDGVAKLLDLGLARAASATTGAAPAGTPGYMSPEQQRGEPLDARSDVWALGRVLHELGAPERIARRCLEDDRRLRYGDAGEVVLALEAARRPSRRWPWAIAALALVVAVTAVLVRPAARPLRVAPARRLTGHAMTRPFSDAALSADGKTFAYIDDDGLFVGETARPERVKRVDLGVDQPGIVETAPTGFFVMSPPQHGEGTLRHVEGDSTTQLMLANFHFVSSSWKKNRVVTIEGERSNEVVVRRLPGKEVSSTVTHPPERSLHAAHLAPGGDLYALAYSERRNGESLKHLELWALDGTAPVWSLQTQALSQAYVPVVFGFSARGALLYALADAPGTGNGASVWSLDGPDAEPVQLEHVDGQLFRTLSQAEDGTLLTMRESAHLRPRLADVAASGSLSNPRALGQSELDERPAGWESPGTVLLMSMRDFVPHLARRTLGGGDAEWVEAKGWAQTWPAATGRDGELLYWSAEKGEGALRWSLMLKSGVTERALQLPAPVTGWLSTMAPPPYTQRARCAAAVRACVLVRAHGDDLEVYDLALDGGAPKLRFSTRHRYAHHLVWALSADAERIAVVENGTTVRVYARSGLIAESRTVERINDVRGLTFDAPGTGFYVAGMLPDWQQTVGWLPAGGAFVPLETSPSAYAELSLSPDGRALVYLEKEFDADLWLTPVRGD
ncbi:MAG: serine/threonine protein kinase [Myxococcaceae bacterium]|nr:serine/threonine protein kinase [Myxococcaceae bacterium]